MTVKSNMVERWASLGIVAVTLLSRIPFRAQMPYGLDSIQFVLATNRYDVRLHQPHPPGYFLFVMMGRLLQTLLPDPNLSFILLSMISSTLAVWLVFCLARQMSGTRSAVTSMVLMATSPVVWFHGEVALSNAADCFFVCLLALLCWRAVNRDYTNIYLSALVLGLAGGIRQNTLLFMAPLWFLSIRKAGLRRCVLSFAILSLAVVSWYVPMAVLSGGVGAYQSALRDHWLNSNWHGFTAKWMPFNFLCVAYFMLLGTGPGFLFLALGALFYLEKVKLVNLLSQLEFQFFVAWLLPSLGFFLLVYSHPIQTGHSLVYLPALFILLPWSITLCWERIIPLFRPGKVRLAVSKVEDLSHNCLGRPPGFPVLEVFVFVLAVCNLSVFLGMSTAVSHAAIRKYESQVMEMEAQVRSHWSSQQVILINYDFMFIGFRDFMFHLPEYHTYQPRLYSLAGKNLLFAGFLGETQLVEEIEVPADVKWFVLNASEFAKNPGLIEGIRLEDFSQDSFFTSPSGLRLFRGAIQSLPKFFPRIHIRLR
jgi:dolichyl-phosphate-mannose-protein mannosyltransferase